MKWKINIINVLLVCILMVMGLTVMVGCGGKKPSGAPAAPDADAAAPSASPSVTAEVTLKTGVKVIATCSFVGGKWVVSSTDPAVGKAVATVIQAKFPNGISLVAEVNGAGLSSSLAGSATNSGSISSVVFR